MFRARAARASSKSTRIQKKSTWISRKSVVIAFFSAHDRSTRNPCMTHVESLYDPRGIPATTGPPYSPCGALPSKYFYSGTRPALPYLARRFGPLAELGPLLVNHSLRRGLSDLKMDLSGLGKQYERFSIKQNTLQANPVIRGFGIRDYPYSRIVKMHPYSIFADFMYLYSRFAAIFTLTSMIFVLNNISSIVVQLKITRPALSRLTRSIQKTLFVQRQLANNTVTATRRTRSKIRCSSSGSWRITRDATATQCTRNKIRCSFSGSWRITRTATATQRTRNKRLNKCKVLRVNYRKIRLHYVKAEKKTHKNHIFIYFSSGITLSFVRVAITTSHESRVWAAGRPSADYSPLLTQNACSLLTICRSTARFLNSLSLNKAKTQMMLMGSDAFLGHFDLSTTRRVLLDGLPLLYATVVKSLGVWIQPNLDSGANVNHVIKRIHRVFYSL
ncbi:unnamed protein product [Trichogramma brassicae]|uniref:Uncharacterized protein n=1 Tax=Trichogramma brassicae TaxID=86971 RepID=A0A6H5IR28_9HYME|nr:unnamed protein product [Trichogramma brassicae]